MTQSHTIVETGRLLLQVFTRLLIDAFLANDRYAAEQTTGATFPEPFAPPPENGDALDYFMGLLEADSSQDLLVPRLIVRKSDSMVVGSIGVNPADETGSAMTGYSIYLQFEGNGYASEACQALTDYVLATGTVKRIFATIPVGHVASEKVSSRAGMVLVGEPFEEDGKMLRVWERYAD